MLVTATVLAGLSAATSVAGLDLESDGATATTAAAPPPQAAVALRQPTAADLAVLPRPTTTDRCSRYLADFCVEIPVEPVAPRPVAGRSACTEGGAHAPTGSLQAVLGTSGDASAANAVRIRVEVETGLAVDGDCFGDAVVGILRDERGWSEIDDVTFVRVDDDSYDLRLVLASPDTTDSLCYPANTAGKYSCRKQNMVIINLMRWESGTDEYTEDLITYRRYLINHEVGHFLGKGHLRCPAAGEPAPVMMQQTKGLGDCLPNGWPTKDEH